MQAFEIIRLAEKASFVWEELGLLDRLAFYQFADLIADAERDAIIDIVAMHGGSVEIEAAIRARSNT